MGTRAGVIGSVALLFIMSCGGGSSVNRKEIGPCPPGREITGQQLRNALRKHGFSAVCWKDSFGRGVANLTPTGQGDRTEHEGAVLCDAHKFMPPRTEHHPHKVYEWGSVPGHSRPGRQLMLANVECVLYLDSGTRTDAPASIRRAFDALAAGQY